MSYLSKLKSYPIDLTFVSNYYDKILFTHPKRLKLLFLLATHVLLLITLYLAPLIYNNIYFNLFYVCLIIAMICGWILFNGECWINSWEKKILNFAADTSTDDPFTYDNAESFVMNWWLGAGSTYSGGTLNTSAWADNTNANRAAGVLNLADSTDNDWYLTGVQLEFGTFDSTTLPPFQFESYGDNLKRCQRYCQIYTQPPLIGSANAGNTVARASFGLITSMRTGPTATQSGTFSWFYSNSHQPQSTGFSATYTDENTFEADVTMTSSGMTATHPCSVFQSGSAYLLLTADLMAG